MAQTTTVTKKPVVKPVAKSGKKPVGKKQQIVWAAGMPFEKINYILMIGGILVLLLGYILLSGGGSEDPTKYSDAIFDTRRLFVGPIVLVIGFAIEFFAIMYRTKVKNNTPNTSEK
jgi:hypothetical protein